MRVTSEFWVSALIRRSQKAGAFATVIHRGAKEAGAIFLVVNDLEGGNTLYGPAPQADYSFEGGPERQFECLLENTAMAESDKKIDRERNFDPDIWVVEIEDREGRTFLPEE